MPDVRAWRVRIRPRRGPLTRLPRRRGVQRLRRGGPSGGVGVGAGGPAGARGLVPRGPNPRALRGSARLGSVRHVFPRHQVLPGPCTRRALGGPPARTTDK